MAMHKCPGMSPRFFKHSDVKERNCIHCNKTIEFWKDDIRVTCHSCGKVNFNPHLGNTCLVWCKSAAQCLGSDDIKEWKEKQKGKENDC